MKIIEVIDAIHDVNAKLTIYPQCYYYNEDLNITQLVYNYFLDKNVEMTIENNIITFKNK